MFLNFKLLMKKNHLDFADNLINHKIILAIFLSSETKLIDLIKSVCLELQQRNY